MQSHLFLFLLSLQIQNPKTVIVKTIKDLTTPHVFFQKFYGLYW